jgi:hypothetical protein
MCVTSALTYLVKKTYSVLVLLLFIADIALLHFSCTRTMMYNRVVSNHEFTCDKIFWLDQYI